MTILIIAVSSIIFYTHILPILDRITEYIQAIILTKKMKINVEYTKYEKLVNSIGQGESEQQRVIGFQIDATEEEYEDE